MTGPPPPYPQSSALGDPPVPAAPARYGPPPGSGYGLPPYGYPPSPYGYGPPPGYGYPPRPSRGTNGFAIASLVLGIICLYWVGSVLAIIFGFIARKQIRDSGDQGRAMATAGIVLGFSWFVLLGVLVLLGVSGAFDASTEYPASYPAQYPTY